MRATVMAHCGMKCAAMAESMGEKPVAVVVPVTRFRTAAPLAVGTPGVAAGIGRHP